jgi:CBS domain-containing protein
MTSLQQLDPSHALTLNAATAADLMTPNPVSIHQNATVKEAAAFLADRKISAAPVIDDAGRAVGVLSRADIVVQHRQEAQFVPESSDYYERTDLAAQSHERFPAGFQVENVDRTQVRDIMTPLVLAASLNDSACKVITQMVDEKVHRLFVLDGGNVLVGVISALDILRRLY